VRVGRRDAGGLEHAGVVDGALNVARVGSGGEAGSKAED
jgi:hypothetical protein